MSNGAEEDLISTFEGWLLGEMKFLEAKRTLAFSLSSVKITISDLFEYFEELSFHPWRYRIEEVLHYEESWRIQVIWAIQLQTETQLFQSGFWKSYIQIVNYIRSFLFPDELGKILLEILLDP